MEHPGHRARNLDVANAYGLVSGLCDIKGRVTARKDCPAWLSTALFEMIHKANCLIEPLIQHRDELKKLDTGKEPR